MLYSVSPSLVPIKDILTTQNTERLERRTSFNPLVFRFWYVGLDGTDLPLGETGSETAGVYVFGRAHSPKPLSKLKNT